MRLEFNGGTWVSNTRVQSGGKANVDYKSMWNSSLKYSSSCKVSQELVIQEKMIHMVGMLFQIWWLGWGTKKAKAGNICYHLSSRKKIKVNHFISLVNLFWWYIKFNGGTCEWEVWTSLLFSAFCEPLRLKFHMDFLIKSAWNLSLRDSSSFIELEFQSLEMLVYKIV